MVPQTLTPESFNPVEEQGALSGYHGGAIATDETVTAPTGYEIVCVRGLDDTSAISAQTGNFDFAAEVIGKTGDYVGRWSSVTVVARVAYWLIRKYN